ncbi:hypothetical protein [Brucella sp. 10RB9213]|uniref:hypothetical protein n=1 Tax=Brucella sp. 10RB9213 TaxID=1844039 RepID=UPI0012AD8F82|nr:hypothetical protein [Brucella sp. 10RB9213]MRN66784.1 hypothetical protein [Brucella sp. 10RB9213]
MNGFELQTFLLALRQISQPAKTSPFPLPQVPVIAGYLKFLCSLPRPLIYSSAEHGNTIEPVAPPVSEMENVITGPLIGCVPTLIACPKRKTASKCLRTEGQRHRATASRQVEKRGGDKADLSSTDSMPPEPRRRFTLYRICLENVEQDTKLVKNSQVFLKRFTALNATEPPTPIIYWQ